MIANKETVYTKDVAKKQMKVTREFDAPVTQVWKCWTEPKLMDQWWAPKPWHAHTQSMDFQEGGRWLYYMEGPDGTRHYCRADYETIVPNKRYTGLDAFCDEKGEINSDMPRMEWDVSFVDLKDRTRVDVVITFPSEEDMDRIIEMGFKEGFAAAHENLDELLAKG